MRLENKVALISGGARGIGAAIARIFAQEGAKLVIGDILEEDGRRTAAEITQGGGECFFVRLDVTNEADWEQAAGEVITRFGRLDILVNNAGISARGNVEETSEADWTRTMDVNVKGAFLGSRQAIPLMRNGGGGSIINISSGAGIAPQPGTSGAYAASKGAVRIFSKSTAVQYAGENIRCNSVHPGPIETDMLRATRPDADNLEAM
ncbi:MAG: SDR family NAD(P)-dependent oxidoreductase, partial [Chloroflexi bacterium]|nr:SDR family NAD(P)-dependent oxidoreductase [Chloroflexota bacterium]